MYYPENHSKVRGLTPEFRNSFYYGCQSVRMNLLFNGRVKHRFKGLVTEITKISGCRASSKILLYHTMLAMSKEVKGFVVPLRNELFTTVHNDNPSRRLPSYRSFTSAIEGLVQTGYGTLYRGDPTNLQCGGVRYKSVFVFTDKLSSLFSKEDKTFFPEPPNMKYNDLVRVMSGKNKSGNRHQLDVSPRGINKYKDEMLEIRTHLSKFQFLTDKGDRFYPELYRSFVNNLSNFGRVYFTAQSMESKHRPGITIDGEYVREDDLVSNHAFICAEEAGVVPSQGFKPYDIPTPGLVTSVPSGGSERDVYKTGVMCLLSCKPTGAARAFKNTWRKELGSYGGIENSNAIINQLKKTNSQYLHIIEGHTAASLQKLDSEILMKAMQFLMKRDIPFLPYHDSLLTPAYAGGLAKEAFEYGWENILGSKNCCFVERKY